MIEIDQRPLARLIALYLPQFHPIPENDEWWGKGFTEWTNVTKARPLYRGHCQPRLPADLGFYDLRIPEVREAQAKLARECGVEGFCYWHYWFGGGRRIMERPFNEILTSGKPDFPFCLAWANHSWTAIWQGQEKKILIEQTYPGFDDERAHFLAVLPAFLDSRYIRVDRKPVFVVFRPWELPDPSEFISHWRHLAQDHGLPGIYFVGMSNDCLDPRFRSFDAITTNPPYDFMRTRKTSSRIVGRLRSRNFGARLNRWFGALRIPTRVNYSDVVERAFEGLPDELRFLPCVISNWDNTPRSGVRGLVFENATPALFGRFLIRAIERVSNRPEQHRIIFLKAWNEWAEGNFVEPGRDFGSGFLDTIKSALFKNNS